MVPSPWQVRVQEGKALNVVVVGQAKCSLDSAPAYSETDRRLIGRLDAWYHAKETGA